MRYIYLHGFASGPGTRKGQYFREQLSKEGIALEIPDLNQGDFSHTTISRQLTVVEGILRQNQEPVFLLGSSLGGFLAALAAERFPIVKAIFILAPGFDFYARRTQMLGKTALQEWERKRVIQVFHHHLQKMVPIDYQFVEDAKQYDGVIFNRQFPAMIVHGLEDDVVPWEVSVRYLQSNKQAQLILLHTDHSMVDVLPTLWNYFVFFRNQVSTSSQ